MNDPRLKRVIWVDGKRLVFADETQLRVYVKGDILIGRNTWLSPSLRVGMPDKPLDKFIVGDGVRIYAGQIAPRNFVCGDYVTIHEGVWAYGRNDITIGHNAWFGKRVTMDAEGSWRVGNGFGAGQDTHLWSHIRHGDILAGSKYLGFGEFYAEDDVWFVGRCTSSPAHHESKSMALVESNVTRGMLANHIYGGNPAKDLTDRLGTPYRDMSHTDQMDIFDDKCGEFLRLNPDVTEDELFVVTTTFDVSGRTYTKMGSSLEARFMAFLLPEAKFVPDHQPVVIP